MARWSRDENKEQYWRRVLVQWQGSQSTTVRGFCAAQGVSQASFYWWRRAIQRRDQERPRFLPVKVVNEVEPNPIAQASGGDSSAIEVVLGGGRCLRVRPGFDRATLVRLLDVLGEGGVSC
jgi:hypothetical protein